MQLYKNSTILSTLNFRNNELNYRLIQILRLLLLLLII
jgi:hypothetical protein